MSQISQQSEIRTWFNTIVENYDNPMIATLTYPNPKLQEFASQHRQITTKTRNRVISDLEMFHHKISRMTYKNANRRYGKKVDWCPVLEGYDNDNLHCHMLIDIPKTAIDTVSYPDKGNRRFNSLLWGYGISELQRYNIDDNWISYITKFSTKKDFTDNILYQLM